MPHPNKIINTRKYPHDGGSTYNNNNSKSIHPDKLEQIHPNYRPHPMETDENRNMATKNPPLRNRVEKPIPLETEALDTKGASPIVTEGISSIATKGSSPLVTESSPFRSKVNEPFPLIETDVIATKGSSLIATEGSPFWEKVRDFHPSTHMVTLETGGAPLNKSRHPSVRNEDDELSQNRKLVGKYAESKACRYKNTEINNPKIKQNQVNISGRMENLNISDVFIKNDITTKKVFLANSKRIPPVITLYSNDLIAGKADFFIDTGSQVSLIKASALKDSVYVDKSSIIRICSITNDFEFTKGEVTLNLENLPCNLHIIDDIFCLDTTGLIGLDILEKYNSNIDIANMKVHLGPLSIPFKEKERFLIQANSKQIIFANI